MVSFCYATDSCSEALSAVASKLPLQANSSSTANASKPLCAATARPTTGGKTVPSWMLKMLGQSDDDNDDEIPGPEYNGHATKTISRSAILVTQDPHSDDTDLTPVGTVSVTTCSPSDTPCLSSSVLNQARSWSTDEDRACILEMTEVCKDPAFQGKDKRWNEVSRRLATRHSITRSGNAVKNQWNRRLRKETNGEIEDRSAKRSDRLVTSTLTTTSSSTSTTTLNSTLTSPDSIANTTPISIATSAAKSASNAATLITPCRKRARMQCGNEGAMPSRHKARKMTTPVEPASLFRPSASSQARPAPPMIYKQMRMVSKEEAACHPSHNGVRSGHTAARVSARPSKTMAEKRRAQNVEVDSENEATYTPSLKSKAALKVRMLLEDSDDDYARIGKVSKRTPGKSPSKMASLDRVAPE